MPCRCAMLRGAYFVPIFCKTLPSVIFDEPTSTLTAKGLPQGPSATCGGFVPLMLAPAVALMSLGHKKSSTARCSNGISEATAMIMMLLWLDEAIAATTATLYQPIATNAARAQMVIMMICYVR